MNNRAPRYSNAENAWIEANAGMNNIQLLYASFVEHGKVNGWPVRTFRAFRQQINNLGYSQSAEFNGWNCQSLAVFLGISNQRVASWVRRKILHSTRVGGTHCITVRAVRSFAAKHPSELAGICPDRLRQVLTEDLVKPILGQRIKPKLGGVRRVSDGYVFATVRQCAMACHSSETNLYYCIRHKKLLAGELYERVQLISKEPKIARH